MNIFDFAMQMEKDGENYYREIAGKSKDKGMVSIMNLLAEEEVKHYELLHEMKTRTPKLPPAKILENIKNVFIQMREKGGPFKADLSQVDMYKKAQELEKASLEFYEEKSGQVEKPGQKEIFLKLADEEKRHYHILENIIIFVSRPDHWLENAEFHKLDHY